MERLTYYDDDVFVVLNECQNCNPGNNNEACGLCEHQDSANSRLAAYEDTGKTPEQVAEWAKAEREGRCVVLNEDVVIAAVRKAILINTDEKRYRYELGKACLTSCCKDAYKYLLQLTREAAEAALKERENDA